MLESSNFKQLRKAIFENDIKAAESLIPTLTIDELNKINANGNTLLILAIYEKRYKICHLLIENGADPNIANKHRNPPLLLVLNTWPNGPNKTAFIKKLLRYGARIKALLDYYFYYLPRLSLDDLRLLFKEEPRLANTPINPYEDSALTFAVRRKNFALIHLLLGIKADPHTVNTLGETPSEIAKKTFNVRERDNCSKLFEIWY